MTKLGKLGFPQRHAK